MKQCCDGGVGVVVGRCVAKPRSEISKEGRDRENENEWKWRQRYGGKCRKDSIGVPLQNVLAGKDSINSYKGAIRKSCSVRQRQPPHSPSAHPPPSTHRPLPLPAALAFDRFKSMHHGIISGHYSMTMNAQ